MEYQGFDPEDFDFEETELLIGAYIYKGGDISPQPGETWALSVITPDGKNVTGETTLPPKPDIDKDSLPEVFNINSVITMRFAPLEENVQIINIGNLLSYFGPYYYDYDQYDHYYGCYDASVGPTIIVIRSNSRTVNDDDYYA